MLKRIIVAAIFLISTLAISQNTSPTFVNIYVDSDAQIYLENRSVTLENLKDKMRNYSQLNELYKKEPVVYRVYADRRTKMGLLTDISVNLREAYGSANTKIIRYFLNTKKLDVNSGTWQKEIEKLDLDAVEN